MLALPPRSPEIDKVPGGHFDGLNHDHSNVSVLVSLALIPLALAGACILFAIGWWLLPYLMVLCGGLLIVAGLGVDSATTGSLGSVLGLTGAVLLVVGGYWSRERYVNRPGRR